MAAVDRLDPLPPVVVGGVTFLVDRSRPVAVLRAAGGSERVITWPNAPLPARTAIARVHLAPGHVWAVYAEEGLNPAATAVRIDVDGRVQVCELGSGAAIGADDEGVWLCSDPYLAMKIDLDASEPEGGGDVSDGPPAGIEHAALESWEDLDRAERDADQDLLRHVAATASPLPEVESSGRFAAPGRQAQAPGLSQPPGTVPTGAAGLRRVRADGGVDEVVVSRVVSQVEVARPGVLRVLFHPTGPMLSSHVPDEQGRPYRWVRRAVEIDVAAALPASIDLDAVASAPAEDAQVYQPRGRAESQGDHVDLTGIGGTRWTLRALDEDEITAAVQAVVDQYATLEQHRMIFTSRDQRWHRVTSRYADLTVRAEGAWPHTEVVADFTHLPEPGHRLRRRTYVFDHAGVPIASPYLEDHLAGTDLHDLPVREGHHQI